MNPLNGLQLKLCGDLTSIKAIWTHSFTWRTFTSTTDLMKDPRRTANYGSFCWRRLAGVTLTHPIDFAANTLKGQKEMRSCSRQANWVVWRRSVISELYSQPETGQGLTTQFVLPSGTAAPRNAVTQTHSTISDSCIYSATASKVILRRVCDGSCSQQGKGMSIASVCWLTCIGMAITVFPPTHWRRRDGTMNTVKLNFIG